MAIKYEIIMDRERSEKCADCGGKGVPASPLLVGWNSTTAHPYESQAFVMHVSCFMGGFQQAEKSGGVSKPSLYG